MEKTTCADYKNFEKYVKEIENKRYRVKKLFATLETTMSLTNRNQNVSYLLFSRHITCVTCFFASMFLMANDVVL